MWVLQLIIMKAFPYLSREDKELKKKRSVSLLERYAAGDIYIILIIFNALLLKLAYRKSSLLVLCDKF